MKNECPSQNFDSKGFSKKRDHGITDCVVLDILRNLRSLRIVVYTRFLVRFTDAIKFTRHHIFKSIYDRFTSDFSHIIKSH